jgi:aromatic-L-amino-acid decarboxylase
MDAIDFRKRGKQMVDYIADYLENIESRRVLPEVQPGYLREMIPNKAPKKAEAWKDVMKDVDNAIMPGVRIHH